MIKYFNKKYVFSFFNHLFDYIISFSLFVMTILVFVNVISRYIFRMDLAYSYEVVTILFLWLVVLAAVKGFEQDRHLGISFLADRLKGKKAIAILLIRTIGSLIVFSVWLVVGFKMAIAQHNIGLTTPALNLPGWLSGIAIPIGGGMIIISIIRVAFTKAREVKHN